MRYTYESKRGGNMNIMMLMVCDMEQSYYLSSLVLCTHGLSHTQDKISIGYEINGKLYHLKPIEYDNMNKGKDVTNPSFHQAS